MLYGASDGKLGETAKHAGREASRIGEEIRRRWMERFPALKDLVERVQKAAERGYLIGLDGRRMPIRYKHAALNFLCQGGASVIIKTALCKMHQIWHNTKVVDTIQVGVFHDEVQVETTPEQAEFVGKSFIEGLKFAERYYSIRCPLDGTWSSGRNWAETH